MFQVDEIRHSGMRLLFEQYTFFWIHLEAAFPRVIAIGIAELRCLFVDYTFLCLTTTLLV